MTTHPTPTAVPHFLQLADLGLLMRFDETCQDGQSYDIGKDAVKRLAELGCLQNHGFGRYSITSFGSWVLEHEFMQNPSLPLKTTEEHNAAARAAMEARNAA